MSAPAFNRFEWLKALMQAADVHSAAKNVAAVLAITFANEETGQINPSISTIATSVGASVHTVKRAITALEKAGWLGRTEGRGRGNHTHYTLLSPSKVIAMANAKRPSTPAQEKGGKGAPLRKQKGATAHFSIIRINKLMNKQRARAHRCQSCSCFRTIRPRLRAGTVGSQPMGFHQSNAFM